MKKVVGARPAGYQILVELLTEQELLNTVLHITGNKESNKTPEGYVRAFGPMFDHVKHGLSVGDRVQLTGTFVPAPKHNDSHRQYGLVEWSAVKSVLVEE